MRKRIFFYELTHPTVQQLEGFVFSVWAKDAAEADRKAAHYARLRDCGWRRQQVM